MFSHTRDSLTCWPGWEETEAGEWDGGVCPGQAPGAQHRLSFPEVFLALHVLHQDLGAEPLGADHGAAALRLPGPAPLTAALPEHHHALPRQLGVGGRHQGVILPGLLDVTELLGADGVGEAGAGLVPGDQVDGWEALSVASAEQGVVSGAHLAHEVQLTVGVTSVLQSQSKIYI